MGLLTSLELNSVVDVVFTSSTFQRWFTKYKGGQVDFVLDDRFKEPGGFDWCLIDDENVFERFARLRPLAEEMSKRGNDVKFVMSFCQLSIKFLNTNEAVLFRMKL